MRHDQATAAREDQRPQATRACVHVISDSLGTTACEVAQAAAGQFCEGAVEVVRLPKVSDVAQVERHLEPRMAAGERMAVLFTIASPELRARVRDLLARKGVPAVDLLGPTLDAIAAITGEAPHGIPGTIHRTDERYFRRIEAMEYFVEHDDGRGADDLSGAEIVLIGVSRTGKTPLSMYLAYQGYRVANIPLAHGMEPPASLADVDPARVFGLISTTDVIAAIRDQRLGDELSRAHAGSYADPSCIDREMGEARALMRRLGCFTVRTDGKAIEESAAEITARLEEVARARAALQNALDS
ncbi:pyruvate, water dikinase regulatory protein [Corynebacterium sp.]|uniref:pyruvate, water dikinase regulatory protein n=1 Tax=Corynebacterium sp. TaxID=1720 RepID=UPI0026DC83B7|nr:pyruvate, water dikinase regulatory protein [Corynebacterium sp.]MDO5032518.1 pyruvate, water dikinase regulatory protein [Corynebacterium sp.]